MRKSVIMLGLVGLLLGGCSTVPKELAYEPADQLVAYQPALQGMEGKPARWSGVISAVHNKADQSVIEVVYLPLKSNGVPEQTEQSPGRFLAIMQGIGVEQQAGDEGGYNHGAGGDIFGPVLTKAIAQQACNQESDQRRRHRAQGNPKRNPRPIGPETLRHLARQG